MANRISFLSKKEKLIYGSLMIKCRISLLPFLMIFFLSPFYSIAQTSFEVVQADPYGMAGTVQRPHPFFSDLDNDDDLDILVGDYHGNFYYYQNTGTRSVPNFATPVVNPFSLTDVGFEGVPIVLDLDNDGDMDVISGNFSGNFIYFENTGNATNPSFGTFQTNPFSLTDIGANSRPGFADIDNDGDIDIFGGEGGGSFKYFENVGSATLPSFASAVTNPFSLSSTDSFAAPKFADLDSDGDLDLMASSGDGNFYYYENVGTATLPSFSTPVINPFALNDIGSVTCSTIGDLDDDGDLDILSARVGTGMFYFQNNEAVIWDGETSNDWNTATNWIGDVLPTTSKRAIIPYSSGESARYPTITTSVKINKVQIEQNSKIDVVSESLEVLSLLIVDGSITVNSEASLLPMGKVLGSGSATIHRNTTFGVNDGQYSVIGSPITSGTTRRLGSNVYSYDETVPYGVNGNSRFSEVTGPTTMTPGDAYFSANTGNIFFQGTPNAGSINTPLIYDETRDGGSANAGFNLVSNPYPSAIGYTDFVSANADIDGTIYLWDDGGSDLGQRANADYITVTSMGATGGSSRSGSWDGHMRSCQGFFVKATTAGTLIFDPSMMQTSNNTDVGFFRKESPSIPKVRLSLTSEEGYSDILLGFAEEATSGFDRTLDAYKVKGNSTLQLYSRMDASILAIQALAPLQSETTIDLGFDTENAGQHTISIENASIDAGLTIMLIDHELDKEVNLSQTKNYSFSSAAVVNSSRFQLLFTKHDVLSLDENLDKPHLIVYADENAIYLKTDAQLTQAHISIYTIGGNLLSRSHTAFYEGKASVPFSDKGLFIVRLESENGIITQKFFH